MKDQYGHKDRNHVYLYTVATRDKDWKETKQVEACNIQQAVHKLNQKLDDVRYVDKRIL